jgi:thiol-disulfide isomerase/thioredoxin
MQNPHAVVPVAVLLFACATPCQEVDLDQAQKDLDFVFARPPGRVDVDLVRTRFVKFFKKYEGKELGRVAHARGLSLYWNRERDKALLAFDKYLAKHDPTKIPSEEQRSTMGRAYLSAAVKMARGGKIDADRFVDIAAKFARCYHDVRSVGGIVTRYLDGDHAKLAARARLAMVKEVIKKPGVSAVERDAMVKGIFAAVPVRAAAGRRAAGAVRVRPAAPTTIQPFSETAMSGRVIDLKAYRGQVVLVDFWATWCGPCLREMPNVAAAYAKHHKSGFEVVGVSLDKKGAEKKIAAAAEKYGMPWEQIYDGGFWGAKLAKKNGIRSIPAAFLIDRAGKVRFSGRETRGDKLIKNLELLLAED